MQDWKIRAKRAIANANLTVAFSYMERGEVNRIVLSKLYERYSQYEKLENKVRSEKRTYTNEEFEAQTKLYNQLISDMIAEISAAE